MNIVDMATSLNEIETELDYLKMDLLSDEKEIIQKEKAKRKLMNELLFYDEFAQLYENNKKYELDSTLLYPFKTVIDEKGNQVFERKTSDEYKDDVNKYLEDLTEAFNQGMIDQKTFKEMKEKAIELANKQLDRIEKEEKDNKIDISSEYEEIVRDIENTKEAFVMRQIGEDSYQSLSYKYKNMQEVDRKELLHRTHNGLCNEMGIAFEMDFTKYDIDDDKTVTNDGYCIKSKDINGIPYPLDLIISEQTYKLYIGQVLKNNKYSPEEKSKLTSLLYNSLSKQKEVVLEKIKKRELTPYGC